MLEGRPVRDRREARHAPLGCSPLSTALLIAVGVVIDRMEYGRFIPDENRAIVHRPASGTTMETFFVCGVTTEGNWCLHADCLVDDRDPDQTRVVVTARVGRHYNCPPHLECLLDHNHQVLSLAEVEAPPPSPPNPALYALTR